MDGESPEEPPRDARGGLTARHELAVRAGLPAAAGAAASNPASTQNAVVSASPQLAPGLG